MTKNIGGEIVAIIRIFVHSSSKAVDTKVKSPSHIILSFCNKFAWAMKWMEKITFLFKLNHPKCLHILIHILLQVSGVPLNAAGRIQINLELEAEPEIEILSKLPKMIFPLFWFEITVDLPEYLVNLLKYTLFL